MSYHNGNSIKMLTLIKERGEADSTDLFEACGIRPNNQPGLLSRYVDTGLISSSLARARDSGKRVRRYRWREGAVLPEPTFVSEVGNATPGPNERGMRACLGPLCRGQRKFMSSGAGNRICPRCKAAAENASARCGMFDTPHVVLNP